MANELDTAHPIFRELAHLYYAGFHIASDRWMVQDGYVYAWMPCMIVRQPCGADNWEPEHRTPKKIFDLFLQSTPGDAIDYPEMTGDDYLTCNVCKGTGEHTCPDCSRGHDCGICFEGKSFLRTVQLGPLTVAIRWLRILQKHNAILHLPVAVDARTPFWFKIDGGIEGLVAQTKTVIVDGGRRAVVP